MRGRRMRHNYTCSLVGLSSLFPPHPTGHSADSLEKVNSVLNRCFQDERNNDVLVCDMCQISFNSLHNKQSHYIGKLHIKRLWECVNEAMRETQDSCTDRGSGQGAVKPHGNGPSALYPTSNVCNTLTARFKDTPTTQTTDYPVDVSPVQSIDSYSPINNSVQTVDDSTQSMNTRRQLCTMQVSHNAVQTSNGPVQTVDSAMEVDTLSDYTQASDRPVQTTDDSVQTDNPGPMQFSDDLMPTIHSPAQSSDSSVQTTNGPVQSCTLKIVEGSAHSLAQTWDGSTWTWNGLMQTEDSQPRTMTTRLNSAQLTADECRHSSNQSESSGMTSPNDDVMAVETSPHKLALNLEWNGDSPSASFLDWIQGYTGMAV